MTKHVASHSANRDQIDFWNSPSGAKWVEYQERLDGVLAGVQESLLDRAGLAPRDAVLDIGCGAGATSLASARRVAPGGTVLGADVSQVLLDHAEVRVAKAGAANVRFVLADVQTHPFDAAAFNVAISRFGVMFFADSVAAFSNISRSLRTGGRLEMACWAGYDDNPWFHLAGEVAIARLGAPTPAAPHAPGPLAFADTAYVLDILRQAGLKKATVETCAIGLDMGASLSGAVQLLVNFGPTGRILREKDGTDEDLAAIVDAVGHRLGSYASGEGYRLPASIHFYSARAA